MNIEHINAPETGCTPEEQAAWHAGIEAGREIERNNIAALATHRKQGGCAMTDRYETRASTHADDCWSWGPAHYECAVREIERLRKMHQDAYQRGLQAGSRGLREMYDAVQAVKRQDAWGNTQLTEALMEAEERAERAEAENKRLRKDAELYRWLLERLGDA